MRVSRALLGGVRQAFDDMRCNGIASTEEVFLSLFSACAQARSLPLTRETLSLMEQEGVPKSAAVYRALVHCAVRSQAVRMCVCLRDDVGVQHPLVDEWVMVLVCPSVRAACSRTSPWSGSRTFASCRSRTPTSSASVWWSVPRYVCSVTSHAHSSFPLTRCGLLLLSLCRSETWLLLRKCWG